MPSWQAIGIFCDDIRLEAQNKQSVMGIFPDRANVTTIPGAIPRLGVYVRIQMDPSASVSSFSVSLRFPDGKEDSLGRFESVAIKETQARARNNGLPWAGFVVSAVAINFPTAEEGLISIIARVDDEEMICGSLKIEANASTEPPPPA